MSGSRSTNIHDAHRRHDSATCLSPCGKVFLCLTCLRFIRSSRCVQSPCWRAHILSLCCSLGARCLAGSAEASSSPDPTKLHSRMASLPVFPSVPLSGSVMANRGQSLRQLLSGTLPVRDLSFSQLTHYEAMDLVTALQIHNIGGAGNFPLRIRDYGRCVPKLCEEPLINWPPNFRLALPTFVLDTNTLFEPPLGLVPGFQCANIAFQPTQAVGGNVIRELWTCHERHDDPVPGTHPRVNPQNPLVCQPCKNRRWLESEYRKEMYWFGICADCRIANPVATARQSCRCQPNGRWGPTSAQNPNVRDMHLCREHGLAFYTARLPATLCEINARLS